MGAVSAAIAVVAMLSGAIFYNPLRRKMSGVIGVGGSYLILFGIMILVMCIGQLISGDEVASMTEFIMYIIVMVLALGYMVYVMLTRCDTVLARVLLPFAACLIGLGFCWRLLAALFLHIPMEDGTSEKKSVFPQYLYSPDGEQFELENNSGDNATYYCSRTGQRASFRDCDFEEGPPSGWHN